MPDFHPIAPDCEDANSITMSVCSCPHVHIILYDEGGAPFARALVTPEQLSIMVRDVENEMGHPLPRATDAEPRRFGNA